MRSNIADEWFKATDRGIDWRCSNSCGKHQCAGRWLDAAWPVYDDGIALDITWPQLAQ